MFQCSSSCASLGTWHVLWAFFGAGASSEVNAMAGPYVGCRPWETGSAVAYLFHHAVVVCCTVCALSCVTCCAFVK